MKKLDFYIIFILIATVIFTGIMIYAFWVKSYVPDTLITAWFSYIVGELLCCTIIKTVSERQAMRKESLEDREYFDKKEKEKNNGLE